MPLPVQNLSDIYASQGMNNPQLTVDENGNPIYQSDGVITPTFPQMNDHMPVPPAMENLPSFLDQSYNIKKRQPGTFSEGIKVSDKSTPLTDAYLTGGPIDQPKAEDTPLTDTYLTSKEDLTHPDQTEKSIGDNLKSVGKGALQGVSDVINTGGQAIGWLDKTIAKLIGGNGQQRSDAFNERVNKENADFEQQNGDDYFAKGGRIAGQIAATAPLTPVRAIQGIRAAVGALPVVLSTGERVAAPLANRLLGAAGAGAIGGGAYGAATNSTDPRTGVLPLIENTAEQAVGGAVGGPVMDRAGAMIKGAVPFAKRMANKAAVNVASHTAGVNPRSASKVLSQLEDEGMTIDEAQQTIQKMGPDATIADLTPGLQQYAGGLAARGGRTQAIVSNRFKARNELKNDVAHTEIDKAIGPKPDIEAEKQAILDKAHKDVAPDYDTAHKSNDRLEVKPIISDINKKLESALGENKRYLSTVKGFLYRQGKDAEGNVIQVPRTNVADLHETRMAIDNILSKSKPPQTSVGNQTKAMLTDMRSKVDSLLKSNPQMAAADAKFKKAIELTKDIDYGHQTLDKGNSEEFMKTWSSKSAEGKEAIKKGMRAAVGDKLEKAANGELAGAQQLFGKKSVTRAKLKLAFGSAGDKVLDTLSTEASKRGTENFVASGSRTALNTKIGKDLDIANKPTSLVGDMIKGVALDASTGSLGSGTAVMGAKHVGGSILTRWGEKRHDAYAEGLADLLSRSGKQLDDTFDQLRKINSVRHVVAPIQKVKKELSRLPIASIAASVVGTPVTNAGGRKIKSLVLGE